jgi:DNA-binding XRE family transcriptional regulator
VLTINPSVLRRERLARMMTVNEFARGCGVNLVTMYRIESGAALAREETAFKIIQAFGLDVGEAIKSGLLVKSPRAPR